jgi:phosphonate degradation associated HDIG domain protein
LDPIESTVTLFVKRGDALYLGENVSQREHAQQAANLAVRDHASDALIAAALLHDIGHLIGSEYPAEHGVDGRHEEAGYSWLAGVFGPAVSEPVRLHVAAKRYLCTTDPSYLNALSPASRRSLELQGGLFSGEEIGAFESIRWSAEAVRLRRWDDGAKIPGLLVPGVADYVGLLNRLASSVSRLA